MSTDTDWNPDEMLAELNASGDAQHSARPDNWAAWVGWSRRVNRRIAAQASTIDNFAASLKQVLAKERAERAAEVAALDMTSSNCAPNWRLREVSTTS